MASPRWPFACLPSGYSGGIVARRAPVSFADMGTAYAFFFVACPVFGCSQRPSRNQPRALNLKDFPPGWPLVAEMPGLEINRITVDFVVSFAPRARSHTGHLVVYRYTYRTLLNMFRSVMTLCRDEQSH